MRFVFKRIVPSFFVAIHKTVVFHRGFINEFPLAADRYSR